MYYTVLYVSHDRVEPISQYDDGCYFPIRCSSVDEVTEVHEEVVASNPQYFPSSFVIGIETNPEVLTC